MQHRHPTTFVFQPGTAALRNDVIVGALVAIFGGHNAYEANRNAGSAGQKQEHSTASNHSICDGYALRPHPTAT